MTSRSEQKTIPAQSQAPIELTPLHVEALALYCSVASGQHNALKPAKVPS